MVRTTLFLLLVFYSTYVLGQSSYQIDAQESISLQKILDELSENYDIQFAYPSELAGNTSITTQPINELSLTAFMAVLFDNTGVEFKCVSKNKVLLRKQLSSNSEKKKTSINIKGFIIDQSSGGQLTHGAIYLEDMSVGGFVDDDGKFDLAIESADLSKSIVISFLGYEEKTLPLSSFQNGMTIALAPQSVFMDDVIIAHKIPRLKSDLSNLSIVLNRKTFEDNKASFLGGSDILKAVQLLPGISADDDSSSDIKIRGSNADETMLLLDGMPIYNADHYYSVFSSVNTPYIREVKLYKNIFPIKYSGATAGLLSMESDDYVDKLKGQLNLNLLNSSIAIRTPISDKVSINLGARTSITNVSDFELLTEPDSFNPVNDDSDQNTEIYRKINPDFNFYDLNAKLNIRFSEQADLSISGFKSADMYVNNSQTEFEFKIPNNTLTIYEDYKYQQDWGNQALGSTLKYKLSETLGVNASIHYSNYKDENALSNTIRVTRQNGNIDNGSIATASNNEIQDVGMNVSFELKKRNQTTFGISANQYTIKYQLFNDSTQIRLIDGTANKLTGFGSYNFKLKKLNIELGGRGTFYQRNKYKDFFISPQLLGTYAVNNNHALKFSVGRNQQFLREVNFENRVGQFITIYDLANGNQISTGVSDNLMLGYQFKKGNWMVDVELFHKNINGVLEFTNTNIGFRMDEFEPPPGEQRPPIYRLFSGQGKSSGFDLLINYQNKNYQSYIAYTLSKTSNQVEELFKNRPYPNQNDRRHQLKWINNFSYRKFNFSLNTIYSSGKPYLAISNLEDLQRADFDPNIVYEQLPFYGRIDFGISYDLRILEKNASIGVSVFNVTNRENVKFIQQSYSIQKQGANQGTFSTIIGSESELLNRVVDLNFVLRF